MTFFPNIGLRSRVSGQDWRLSGVYGAWQELSDSFTQAVA